MNVPTIEPTALEGILIVTPRRFVDARGFFSETYNHAAFRAAGIDVEFVQDNQSLSRQRGTLRGLHFQISPAAQAKLVRVARGVIYDVAVDIRRSSPTFGRSVGVTLSAENGKQLFVPRGFAHGFCTLEPDTEVIYKVNAYYSGAHERGLNWCDPALGVDWPLADNDIVLIERDKSWPALADLPSYF